MQTSLNIINNAISGFSNTTTYYMFMISQKPLSQLDEKYYQTDDEVLHKEILPPDIYFNEVLFYKYQSTGDDQHFKKQMKMENIRSVNIQTLEKEICLKVLLENSKIYLLTFATAIEALVWQEGLERVRKTQLEIKRCIMGPLKYNIDILYEQFQKDSEGHLEQMVRTITKDIDGAMNVPDFLPSMENTVEELNYFCDAFYAHNAFIPEIFKQGITAIHLKVRCELMEFWNKNYLDMDAGEILNFGNLIYRYSEVLHRWKISDKRLTVFNRPVISTFCMRLFDNSKDLMFKVINDAMFKCSLNQKKIYVNEVFKNLENHVNICFENYDQVPTLPTAHNLMDMIMTLVTVVQINLITQVSDDDKKFDLEVLVSLVNNDFQRLINNLMKKIHKKTKYQITINDIRGLINYRYLQRNSNKLSDLCLKKLSRHLKFKVKVLYLGHHGGFHVKGLKKFLKALTSDFERLFLGLQQEYQKYNLMEKVCDQILELYFQQFMVNCEGLGHGDMQRTIGNEFIDIFMRFSLSISK